MIYRKRTTLRKRTTRRRPVRRNVRNTRYTRYTRSVPRAIGLPKSIFAKLRYTDFRQASVAASGSDTREYRMNSLFDPDLTGVGGQPYYHDQYSAMFQRYRVYGCSVELRVSCSSATANMYHPVVSLTSYCDTSPGWGTFTNAMNAKRSVFRSIIPGQNIVVLKKYYNLRSLAGVTKQEYNVAEVYQALISSNPSRPIIASFTFQNNDGSNAVTYSYWLRMTFYVKYFDNAEPAPS